MSTDRIVAERVRFADFEFDCRNGDLRRAGSPIKLPPQPAKVLSVLIQRGGKIVPRQELAQLVWGPGTFVDFEQGLNQAIRQVRSVLGDDVEQPRFLETVPKRGYRFIAPVSVIAPESEDTLPVPLTESKPSSERNRRSTGMLLVSALIVVVSLWALGRRFLHKPAASEPHRIESIAVLPLQNLSADPEQTFFSDGMTDELITDLAKIRSLRVISHTSVERYKKTQRPLAEIARELGVDAVVEGTVMRSNRRVRISAQLIDARTDQHLWAESYERDLGDALTLQGEVAQRIAAEIGANLTAGERALLMETQHVDPAGQEAYLKGKFFWNKLNCSGFKKAIEYYQAAIGTDPNFAPAYFGLADSYFNLADWGCAPQEEAFRKSEAAALKAVELDPNLASAHASLGELAFYHEWDWQKAEREFGRALELDSNDSSTHATYAVFLLAMGKREQGLAEIKRARQLDPVSELTNVQAIYVLYLAREYDEAIALAKKTLEMYPDATACYYWLGQLYEIEGRSEESLAAYLKAWSGNSVLVEVARKGGLKAYWLKQLSFTVSNKPPTACWKGVAYAHVGEKEEAISFLDRGFHDHCDGLQFLNADPAYDSLRGDSRFQALIARLNL